MSLLNQIIAFLLFGICSILFTIRLKNTKHLSSAYTRKIFHILIFTAAGFIVFYLDIKAIFLYGIIISVLILLTLYICKNTTFQKALQRVSSSSEGDLNIIVPLISTALGGAISVLLFGKLAIIGLFVTGWGDGLAEPIGSTWGKHKFRTLSWNKEKKYKSIEGSLTFFLLAFTMALVSMILMGFPVMEVLLIVFFLALISVIVEAFSPPGTDNFTVQLAATGIGFLLLKRILYFT